MAATNGEGPASRVSPGERLARTLIRSVVRAFYDTDHTIVVDALMVHSALRDDDLALLMGMNVKPLRRLCGRLKEDGLVSVHSRSELREGSTRPFTRDYYYIHYHDSIDNIKYRIHTLTSRVAAMGAPTVEKKALFCPRCKSEYTELEAMDNIDFTTGGFLCHKCGFALSNQEPSEGIAENETVQRLNTQLASLTNLLREIDNTSVPENDWETAMAAQVPVKRDATNQVAKTEVVDEVRSGPGNVQGLAMVAEKIEVALTTAEGESKAKEEAERERKERIAKQNLLPEWHTRSTVTGEATALGAREEQARREREAHTPVGSGRGDMEEKDKKQMVEDDTNLDAYFAALKAEQERAAREEAEEDEDDDDDDDDDFEDVDVATPASASAPTSAAAPAPPVVAALANGHAPRTSVSGSSAARGSGRVSGHATDDEEAAGRDSKRAKVGSPLDSPPNAPSETAGGGQKSAASAPRSADVSDEDEDELEFEDV
ncbi:TFIIE alpha subunit-domain-containing protein [Cryomyces antarcticus]